MEKPADNVRGHLAPWCFTLKTGLYRDGYCWMDNRDAGRHGVYAQVTDAFLKFTRERGNDLITAMPVYDFPGLCRKLSKPYYMLE